MITQYAWIVSYLILKKKSKCYYCHIGLAITASFVEHFYENQESTICVMNGMMLFMHNESPHFQFKKSFEFPCFKLHYKIMTLSKIMPMLLDIK